MPAITFSGLASGLDTDSIISALVGVERIPLQALEAENRDLQSKSSIIDSLSSSLSDLSTKADALGTISDFLSYTGTSSNDSAVAITTSGDSIPGSYEVSVTDIAYAQRTYSSGVADKDAALSVADQTFDITIGATTTSLTIAANSSLQDVADAINSSEADVTAGIFYDGSNYYLQVVGDETGAANEITFADSGLGLDMTNTVQAAQDATFTVDGFTVSSATNTVSDVLPGTTLELKATTTSAATLTIQSDSEAVKTKIDDFVKSYNSVFSIINAQLGEGKGNETLSGDSTVRSIETQLQRMIGQSIPGLSGVGGADAVLSQLGIETQKDGTILLNSTDLDEALNTDFRGAGRVFAGDEAAGIDGFSALFADLIDGFTNSADGLLTIRKDGINTVIEDNEDRMVEQQAYLDRFEEGLRAQYTALESTMAMLKNQQNYLAQFLLSQ